MQRSSSFIPVTSEEASPLPTDASPHHPLHSKHGHTAASSSPAPSRPAIPTSVLTKLAICMIALFVAPISTYFASLWYWFPGNAMGSGVLAVVVANAVVLVYCLIAAFEEDPKKLSITPLNDTKKEN